MSFPISLEKPQFLILILLIIPALLLSFARYKKLDAFFSLRDFRFQLLSKLIFRSLAWICVVFALSEISIGSRRASIQKSGSNVTFIFDISYSMLARDAPQNLSRLGAVKSFSSSLLSSLSESSFSAVLAKGDGIVAIPETEDTALMENLIQNLSPHLMSSSGSAIASGIEAALKSSLAHSAKMQHIWVFTDGDETDNKILSALSHAGELMIPVTFVGFGSENESEILAGDGKTRVNTAMRSKKLQEICEAANKNASSLRFQAKNPLFSFVDSRSPGSAWKLLDSIHSSSKNSETFFSYETKSVNRHSLFIFLAVIFFVLSFVLGECNKNALKNLKAIFLFSLVFLTISCSQEKKQILEGTWSWYDGKYTSATAEFLNAANKTKSENLSHQYAVFGLSATYLSLGELDSALERLKQLNLDDETLPKEFRSAAFYNEGVIYSQKNDYKMAADCFKKAIIANPTNANAKINLELCNRQLVQRQANAGEAIMQGAAEEKPDNSEMKTELFNLIRETEGKKWRNMNSDGAKDDGGIDY